MLNYGLIKTELLASMKEIMHLVFRLLNVIINTDTKKV